MEAVTRRITISHFLDHPSMDNVDSTLKSYFLAEKKQNKTNKQTKKKTQ